MMAPTPIELEAFFLSLKVAFWSVIFTLPIGLFTAWVLARKDFYGRILLNGIVHLPLVLPPVVIGFFLLATLGQQGTIGKALYDIFGITVIFTWQGAAIASAIMSFPLMVRAIRISIENVDTKLEEMALVMTEAEGDKEKYQKFFRAALDKFGVDSPADLEGAQKKKFFNYVDKNYKGDHEESVDLEEADAKYITDKDQGDRDLQKLIKKHKLTIKTLQKNVNPGYDEVEISGDKREMEKFLKITGDMDNLDLKFNARTKTFENTVKETAKDVDETLDKIREANVEKGRSMRNILADIWKMNEGKNPFEKVKKEEDEDKKSSKTATGKKPTKVEIEPEVK